MFTVIRNAGRNQCRDLAIQRSGAGPKQTQNGDAIPTILAKSHTLSTDAFLAMAAKKQRQALGDYLIGTLAVFVAYSIAIGQEELALSSKNDLRRLSARVLQWSRTIPEVGSVWKCIRPFRRRGTARDRLS